LDNPKKKTSPILFCLYYYETLKRRRGSPSFLKTFKGTAEGNPGKGTELGRSNRPLLGTFEAFFRGTRGADKGRKPGGAPKTSGKALRSGFQKRIAFAGSQKGPILVGSQSDSVEWKKCGKGGQSGAAREGPDRLGIDFRRRVNNPSRPVKG
jgi:hypothetical protein